MNLQPIELQKPEGVKIPKTKKFVLLGGEKVLLNGNLREVITKAIKMQSLEPTPERIKEWIKNF